MIYGKDDMKRFGAAVQLEAQQVFDQMVINLQAQLALNPGRIEAGLELAQDRFRPWLEARVKKLEATL